MKTKADIVLGAVLVKGELATILNDYSLIHSKEERGIRGLVVFTKDCPFAEYGHLFRDNGTFPKKDKKFQVKPLFTRYVFWDNFIKELVASKVVYPLDIEEFIKETVEKVDNLE